MMQSRRRKQGQVELMRLAWRYGGPRERFFAVFIPVSPLLSILGASIFILGSSLPAREGVQVLLASLAVVGGWPSVMSAFYDCAYSAEFHRQSLVQGWVYDNEREYYHQLMLFRTKFGRDGHSPGQMEWGFAYAAIYLAASFAAAPLTMLLYPVLGGTAFTPVLFGSIVLMLALGIGYSAHVQSLFRYAETKGFRLRELRRAIR